nr:peptidoglycan-binding protein [Ruminococcus bromii]
MKTKIISIALAVVTMLSAVTLFSGCSDGEYPVKVANITIESQPKNIVVLDAPTADILIATGYDRYIVGRSDEVDQQSIAVAPSVGSYENPDTDKIINSGTNLVFAGQSINEDAKKKLQDKGIQVVTMSHGDTPKQVETNYVTIGKICGGTKTGAKKGEDTYNELLDKMNNYKQQVNNRNSGILDTVCYLYTEDDRLKMMTSGTYGDMLLGYTGAVNAAVNISDNNVDVATLKIANPNFIFYADNATLDKIKGDTTLASLGAVKTGKILEVSLEEMSRPGNTALEALEKMVYFMYPDLKPKSATDTTKAQDVTASKTDATTASNSKSVADKYNLTITSDLSLKQEDENDTVKAMQLRLYNIGYIADKDNVTGYYGEVTAEAVKKFQKNNGLKETGTADNATLVLLFDSSAKKAK